MLPALYDDQRSSLSRLAAMLVLGGAFALPLTVQGSSVAEAQETTAAREFADPILPGRLTYPTFTITRDPFETDHVTRLPEHGRSLSDSQGDPIGIVLPPNVGAGGDAAVETPGQGVSVRAIVVGERSRALVNVGSKVEVLAVGDVLGDLKVASIDAGGIALSDGSRIPLEGVR